MPERNIIKVLFVDFYGVLSHTKLFESISDPEHTHYGVYIGVETFLFKTHRHIFDSWMCGDIRGEDAIMMIASHLGVTADFLTDVYRSDCQRVTSDEELLLSLQALGSETYKVLITNNIDGFSRYSVQANPLLAKIFDEIHCSYDLGYLKTDHDCQFFRETLHRLAIPVSQAYLIDDTQKNCDAFAYIGGSALRVVTRDDILTAITHLS